MIITAKLAQSTIKYLIETEFSCEGMVERPDIIGAIFGQTEGLLGQDLELRELQRSGRIGRIDVELSNTDDGRTIGKFFVPSSLDSSETSLIAASFETIERIGPYNSKVKVLDVKDVRNIKREFMMDRAKNILERLLREEMPSTSTITERIKDNVRTAQITEYQGLPCGPGIFDSDDVIIVEGRADVINLLKNGIKNAIGLGGATISESIINFSKEKVATLFVDGDRAGDLIVKEIMALGEVDYIAKAPSGKEVEELTKKEIFKSLRERIPVEQFKPEPKTRDFKEFVP